MIQTRYPLKVKQGATFSLTIQAQDADENAVDLTGYTARMQIRETVESDITLLELTTENGRISITGSTGTITLTIAAADTASIDWETGVYDLELVNGAVVNALLFGDVVVYKEVTR